MFASFHFVGGGGHMAGALAACPQQQIFHSTCLCDCACMLCVLLLPPCLADHIVVSKLPVAFFPAHFQAIDRRTVVTMRGCWLLYGDCRL